MNHSNHNNDMSESFIKRFFAVTVLLIPIVITQEWFTELFNTSISIGISRKWIQLFFTTIIFGFSWIFFQHAKHEIQSRALGMMSLVSLAVGSGYIFSVISSFVPSIEVEFFLEISTLIWVLLFGHYLESKSSSAAGNALGEVAKLLPKKSHKIVKNKVVEVDTKDLKKKDKIIVKPGERIPADGIIIEGETFIDESIISGESKPVSKTKGQKVVAGSICKDGSIRILLTNVGENSTVGRIKDLIEQAGKTKPTSQKIADKAAGVLTIVALIISILTLLIWFLVIGQTFAFSITLAITVLIIACPHALGLAIPSITTITTSLAIQNGLFIKDLSKIESIKEVDYVVFDKTGTLTIGEFGVVKVVSTNNNFQNNEILKIAASLEQFSSHVIAKSILSYANKSKIAPKKTTKFKSFPGLGVSAQINNQTYYVGNKKFISDNKIDVDFLPKLDNTVVFVANQSSVLGYILLEDQIKDGAKKAINRLHQLGLKAVMLTGDSKKVAIKVSEQLSIDEYFAEVLPDQKYSFIRDLQKNNKIVLMVGDGINDAPALTQADIGVAVGAGADITIEAGDVILTKSHPIDVLKLILLSKKVYTKMVQNLFWALGYNIVAIPVAAGVLAKWGIFLRPDVGALIMSLSTVIVVLNAMSLKKVNINI